MTHNEWLEQAEEYEKKAQAAYEQNDIIAAELYEQKASASRFCADFASEEPNAG